MDKFSKIEEDLKSRFENLQQDFSKFLVQKRDEYKDFFHRMYFFYFITEYISHHNKYDFPNHERELMGLYNKIALDFWGIFNCLFVGAPIQAAILKRSMLESEVTLQFILKDNTKERLRLYYNYKFIKMWRQLKDHQVLDREVSENYISGLLTFKELRKIKENYDNFRGDYRPGYPENWFYKELKHITQKPSIKTLFSSLGDKYKREYISSYGTYSTLVHGASNITDFYAKRQSDGSDVIVNAPEFEMNNIALGIGSIEVCGRAVISLSKFINQDIFNGYEDYIEKFIQNAVMDF